MRIPTEGTEGADGSTLVVVAACRPVHAIAAAARSRAPTVGRSQQHSAPASRFDMSSSRIATVLLLYTAARGAVPSPGSAHQQPQGAASSTPGLASRHRGGKS
jgi:hypothetical protein